MNINSNKKRCNFSPTELATLTFTHYGTLAFWSDYKLLPFREYLSAHNFKKYYIKLDMI